jgi:hypothetical protein
VRELFRVCVWSEGIREERTRRSSCCSVGVSPVRANLQRFFLSFLNLMPAGHVAGSGIFH